ncbi:hypothetical protein TNCV_2193711 [Trichonephila clavipes]|uniref:Uncharacterized protein n=1 Tax=Trichonephila clavipes TaxID=2585209 RepID=A0A8X6VLE4_TRICX|nr:hypothetical protein TNCV_2193711 [Trichonephila clavipes]
MASKAKILKSIQHFDNVGKDIERFEERIRDAIAEPDCSAALIYVLKSKVENYEKKLEAAFSDLNIDLSICRDVWAIYRLDIQKSTTRELEESKPKLGATPSQSRFRTWSDILRAVWTRRFAGSNLCERPFRTSSEKCSKKTVQDVSAISSRVALPKKHYYPGKDAGTINRHRTLTH